MYSRGYLVYIHIRIGSSVGHFTNSHHGTDNSIPPVLIIFNELRRTGEEARCCDSCSSQNSRKRTDNSAGASTKNRNWLLPETSRQLP